MLAEWLEAARASPLDAHPAPFSVPNAVLVQDSLAEAPGA